jgi:hypothetical protein
VAVAIDFLKADDVGILMLDDRNDALEAVAAVAAAYALVDVVAKDTHDTTAGKDDN